jgi:signal peptidase II
MPQRRSPQAIAFCLLFLAFFTWLDLWTKAWASAALPCDPSTSESCRDIPGKPVSRNGGIVLVPGYLDFSYAENRGAAFGMLNDAPDWVRATLFTSAAAIATGALLWMFITQHGGPLFALSVPLIVSGALGNMVDRWRLGYVVDFIRFHLHDGWEWPTFNVADCTITVGVAFLLIDGMRKPATAERADGARPEGEATSDA